MSNLGLRTHVRDPPKHQRVQVSACRFPRDNWWACVEGFLEKRWIRGLINVALQEFGGPTLRVRWQIRGLASDISSIPARIFRDSHAATRGLFSHLLMGFRVEEG